MKYDVTVTKVGSIEICANSVEEAMAMANQASEDQICWCGFDVSDAEELEEDDA